MGDGLKRAAKAAKATRAKRPTLYGQPLQGADGLWYWRITNRRNGKIEADGGEGYASAGNCRRAFKKLVARIQAGDIELLDD